jgi:predicted  nucleic acid-binding Zn-ribbon protein
LANKPYDAAITQVMDQLDVKLEDRFNTFRASTNTLIWNHTERIAKMSEKLDTNTTETHDIKKKVERIEAQVVDGFDRIEKMVSDRKSRDRTKLLVLVTALGLIPSIAGLIGIYKALS